MPNFMDLTGQKYGRLTVINRAPNIGRFTAWFCVCECGNQTRVLAGHLRMGRIISCGCYKQENSKRKATKHGHWGTKLHMIWLSMRQRCLNPKCKNYKDYGGRGINICQEWGDFSVFEVWAFSHGYKEGLSIERVKVNGNYCPENCIWIPLCDQAKNTRRTLNNRANIDVLENQADLEKACEIMGQPLSWAQGLLLKADGFVTAFYKKE